MLGSIEFTKEDQAAFQNVPEEIYKTLRYVDGLTVAGLSEDLTTSRIG